MQCARLGDGPRLRPTYYWACLGRRGPATWKGIIISMRVLSASSAPRTAHCTQTRTACAHATRRRPGHPAARRSPAQPSVQALGLGLGLGRPTLATPPRSAAQSRGLANRPRKAEAARQPASLHENESSSSFRAGSIIQMQIYAPFSFVFIIINFLNLRQFESTRFTKQGTVYEFLSLIFYFRNKKKEAFIAGDAIVRICDIVIKEAIDVGRFQSVFMSVYEIF